MKKTMLLLAALLLTGAQMLQAQRTITGTVVSAEDNQGIPGVSVTVQGVASTGTTTNIQGQYSLSVPNDATHLVFRYVGMSTQEVAIDGRTTIDVVMQSGATAIEGVVITGYGVSRKASFTGSAVTLGDEVVKRQTEPNVINALQGVVPGLQISNGNGQPGSASTVRIRGLGSINAATAPLYVIDGVPVTVGNMSSWASSGQSSDPLAGLNPEDIESLTVLKDAAATSIYGSRASNGVIVINTKKGVEGKNSINVSLKTGLSMNPQNARKNQSLNAKDYSELMIEGLLNPLSPYNSYTGGTRSGAIGFMEAMGLPINTGHDVDWYDEVTRPGKIHDASISASGGSKRGNYYLSLGYFKDESYVVGSDFERFSARNNVEWKADQWITFGMNLSGSYTDFDRTATGLAYASPIFTSKLLQPTEPIKNPDGTWNLGTTQNGYNPVAILQDENGDFFDGKTFSAQISPYLRLQLAKNVFFQTKANFEANIIHETNYWSATVNPQMAPVGGLTEVQVGQYFRKNITNTINWLPSINKIHNFNILLGQEAQKTTTKSLYSSDQDARDPRIKDLMQSVNSNSATGEDYSSLLSFFGNAEYELMDKYYASVSLRRDASSRFSDDNKWGTFYSVGGKWRFSQENFMKPLQKYIDNATVRVSYGTTGNQPAALYSYRNTYSYGINYSDMTGSAPTGLSNANVKWESKNKFDVGLEIAAFNRISLEVDYYSEVTHDMLYATPVSRTTGFSSILTNFASMSNKGVEIMVNAQLVRTKDFEWTFGLNFTANRNKVLDLGLNGDSIKGSISIIAEGLSYNTLYMKEWGGVNPETGLGGFVQADGSVKYGNPAYYAAAPQRIVGSADARFYGGFNTRVAYKGFDLSANFFYSVGSKFYSNDARYFENDGNLLYMNANYYAFDNRWQKPGDNTKAPAYIFAYDYNQAGASTRWLMNGNYLRVKSITLGYTVPSKYTSKLHLANARIYASIDNLFTWTHKDFRGYEPDADLSGSQAGTYGQPRNFLVGINFGF